jgi:hypothetical protein
MLRPTKEYGGADVNLHTSQSDFEVEMFFVASCSLLESHVIGLSESLNPFFYRESNPTLPTRC